MSWACSNSLGHGAAVIIHIWCHCCPKLWLVLLSKLKYISQSSGQSGSCKLIMKENCKGFQVLDTGRESQRASYMHLTKQWWVRKLHIYHERKPQRFSKFRHIKENPGWSVGFSRLDWIEYLPVVHCLLQHPGEQPCHQNWLIDYEQHWAVCHCVVAYLPFAYLHVLE